MSYRTANIASAPHDVPAMADGARHLLTPDEPRGMVLMALANTPTLGTRALYTRSGYNYKGVGNFQRHCMASLERHKLVHRIGCGEELAWRLTKQGETEAQRLRAFIDRARAAREAFGTSIAGERAAPSCTPMPKGEFRINRPGAYDFERCPSRMGDVRIYRDGRREPVTD